VTAADINDYIRELTGGDYTAKDFRTWHATVLATARASYIDPRVIRHYENGRTIVAVLGDLGRDSDFGDLATRCRAESAVLKLLTVPAQSRTRSSKRS
jgi:DNA topoisomerase IB